MLGAGPTGLDLTATTVNFFTGSSKPDQPFESSLAGGPVLAMRINPLRVLVRVSKAAMVDFGADDCPHLAAGLAYYALFSIFPLLLGLMTVIGFAFHSSEAMVQGQMLRVAGALAPASEGFLAANLNAIASAGQGLGVLSVAGLIWSGSSLFDATQRAINVAWGVERNRSFLGQRLVAFAMMGLLIVVQGGFLVGAAAMRALAEVEPLSGTIAAIALSAGWQVAPVTSDFVLFALVYRYVPNTAVRWVQVWFGAGLAAVLFEASKGLFLWYVPNQAAYAVVYGPLASVIASLFWCYLAAAIMLLGVEICAAHAAVERKEPV